jgi:hypothetical protein
MQPVVLTLASNKSHFPELYCAVVSGVDPPGLDEGRGYTGAGNRFQSKRNLWADCANPLCAVKVALSGITVHEI